MKKIVSSLGFLVAMATLGGCDLYFGPHNDPGSNGGGGSGYTCKDSTQCAAGCYCANGTCTEGGFCTMDSDCGPGYHCDTARSSCEPNPPGCTQNSDCATGSVCNTATGQCVETCTCMTDADAVKQGFGWCDNGTCEKGSDPNGSCAGTVTCTTGKPTCPSGQVPTILNGCWTGNCEAYSACDATPPCADVNDETDCLGQTGCGATYIGIDCHKPDGTACHAGDTNCVCSSFQFSSCADQAGKRVISESGENLTSSIAQ